MRVASPVAQGPKVVAIRGGGEKRAGIPVRLILWWAVLPIDSSETLNGLYHRGWILTATCAVHDTRCMFGQ